MKRLVFCIILTGSFFIAQAQDVATPELNPKVLERKMEKSNEDIQDEKDKTKAKTWFNRGELFQDIAEVNTQFLRLGMGSAEAKLYLNEPKEIKTKEEGGTTKQIYVYENIDLVFENDVLTSWKETKTLHPAPLRESLEAYKKALELDDRDRYGERIRENMDYLKTQFESQAIMAFTNQDFDGAMEAFDNILECSATRVYDDPMMDTVIMYNAGLAARNAGMHDKSIEYFEKAATLGYGGSDTYRILKEEYFAMEDSAGGLDALERGFNLYPDTTILLIEIVNYHLTAGNAEEGLKYLELASEKEADNPSIFFAQGTLYEKTGNKKKALEAYKKALEIDADYFNAHFNIGALYFNNAVALYDTANSKEDPEEYKAARAVADEELRKALGPMKRAHELEPTERAALETLKTIYYRLQMEEEYQAVQQKIDSLSQ